MKGLQFGELDRQRTGRGAGAVDEDGKLLFGGVGGRWEPEGAVEALADGHEAEAEGGGFFKGEGVGDADLEVAFCGDEIGEGAVFVVVRVTCMRGDGKPIYILWGNVWARGSSMGMLCFGATPSPNVLPWTAPATLSPGFKPLVTFGPTFSTMPA